ncbi:ankyrin repeat domain-containing protein [Treponema sp. R80B11-R83G3]
MTAESIYSEQARKDGLQLIAASDKGDIEAVKSLLKKGVYIHAQDREGRCALVAATYRNNLEIVDLLIDAGADVHCTDSYNGTGLIRAADRGHVEIIRELLKTDIRVNHINKIGWTALLEAIILGDGGKRHTEVVCLLVDSGADVNLPDKDGVLPLAHAKSKGYPDIIKILENSGERR